MDAFRVFAPEERFRVVNFRQENTLGVAAVNQSLVDFEPKIVFRWHLSIMLVLRDTVGNGMPSTAECAVLDAFGDLLDAGLKAPTEKQNALFLARITWNATQELIYRVFDPELANSYLQTLITSHEHPREFDFRMDDDPQWNLAAWHLKTARGEPRA